MANIIPSIEKIKKSRQPPTSGELYLIEALSERFDSKTDIYVQPCFNGDRPDIVLINKDLGVIVVEVKDWDLSRYAVTVDNDWILKSNHQKLKSPFAQVFNYKKNFFDIHVNGLLEKRLRDKNFYNIVSVYVYFHCADKKGVGRFYQDSVELLFRQMQENTQRFKNKDISHFDYCKRDSYLGGKKKKLLRDATMLSVTKDNLGKIAFSKNLMGVSFEESIYNEFVRLLCPPYHYENEGKAIAYTKLQSRLSESDSGARAKICGVAGSGKTTVLAKRAVNALKRHEDAVLILTFNITLQMYIKGKISEVREGFSWGGFEIAHYHGFLTSAFNNYGIDIKFFEGDPAKSVPWEQLETNYFSNVNVFRSVEDIRKYKTILVDEVQDYKPEWIKIIREYFLESDGEMVLFGDEKQNIYSRAVDSDRKSKLVEGFGRWEKLTKSFRFKEDSHILKLATYFQSSFLSETYEVDVDESYQPSLGMLGINACGYYDESKLESLVKVIVGLARSSSIHPNDISIISSREGVLQEVDYLIRNGEGHKEKTLTTFPSLEMKKHPKYKESTKVMGNAKKMGFNLNSGVTKLSTIHSFKGYESPFIVLFVSEKDTPEIVYTGLTRAKESIVVFLPVGSKYSDFFKSHLDDINSLVESL